MEDVGGREEGLHEECGVFGIFNSNAADTSHLVYSGLYALQHRGQESCGISINDVSRVTTKKGLGLVGDVFNADMLDALKGKVAIGHVRYSTTGSNTIENAQPLMARYMKGTLAIAHNGNIANAYALRSKLEAEGAVFQSTNDTEIIAFLIAKERVRAKSIEEAICRVIPMLRGSFSMVVMSPGKLIAVRDPKGFRPLCIGETDGALIFTSESCALDGIRARFLRDVRPGEIVIADSPSKKSLRTIETWCAKRECDASLCVFEHIYFARPDSVIDGQCVYDARIKAGRLLAKQAPVNADIVFGVPDSAMISALGFSEQSGIPYSEGLLKNRYIGRTFIQPNQNQREDSVNLKLGVLAGNVRGKRVVMIDDSIVRGTTTEHIVKMLKDAGAAEVHVRISSPKFLWPCYFGVDVPDRDKLVCCQFTEDELRCKIGADSLCFLSLDTVEKIASDSKIGFCTGCFSGEYPIEIPENADKSIFELPYYSILDS